jgi:predicted short-subunit dehydrogenase-like oxidoreductase (DUF2520 family)
MAKSISIIGAGRVARALGRRLRELSWHIDAVCARSETSARKAVHYIGAGRACAGISAKILVSPILLLAIPDDAISEVARELARIAGPLLRGKIILHTSGAHDFGILAQLRSCGAFTGSMHPLQTFSGTDVPPLEGKVFAIDGDSPAVRAARRMVRGFGGVPVSIRPSKKTLYHAAGVFAAGHILALEETAVQTMILAGMNRKEAQRALLSLTRQTLDHYEKFGPRKSWTGPLARRDYGVVAAHQAALRRAKPAFLAAYQSLNTLATCVLSADPASAQREFETISQPLLPLKIAKGECA